MKKETQKKLHANLAFLTVFFPCFPLLLSILGASSSEPTQVGISQDSVTPLSSDHRLRSFPLMHFDYH